MDQSDDSGISVFEFEEYKEEEKSSSEVEFDVSDFPSECITTEIREDCFEGQYEAWLKGGEMMPRKKQRLERTSQQR